MEHLVNKENKRNFKYVEAYKSIHTAVLKGVYPVDSKLPSEKQLTEQYKISRATLRQALKFLKDDGVIRVSAGKGYYVENIVDKMNIQSKNLSEFSNPVFDCIHDEIEETVIDFRMETSTDYTNKILKRDSGLVVFIDRWYKVNNETIAYSLSTIPGDIVTKLELNLKDSDSLIEFLNNMVYKKANHSNLSIKISNAGNDSAGEKLIKKTSDLFLIQEEIYGYNEANPLIFSKHYLRVDNTSININSSKK